MIVFKTLLLGIAVGRSGVIPLVAVTIQCVRSRVMAVQRSSEARCKAGERVSSGDYGLCFHMPPTAASIASDCGGSPSFGCSSGDYRRKRAVRS